ncbi:hypothetical protein PROFUN_12243 [Planoprotostelium fungivorum]|uniref:C2H2-type domain-containing protein n=1 Tax=Planoprotostelium fungivorum TaxID=1890364 RepID=A0A2P6N820_9EUKA|nr:hypothetical protein PROFUN_12243 [Planoprotostelium fungivorum]
MTTVNNIPAKLYYKQKYDRQDVSQGLYDNVIQDYHAGCTRGELCTKYKLSCLKLKIILRDEHSFKIPSADIADIKLKLQNKSITKKEIMGLYKISYRALNHLLSEHPTASGIANDSISYQFATVDFVFAESLSAVQKLLGYFCHSDNCNNYATEVLIAYELEPSLSSAEFCMSARSICHLPLVYVQQYVSAVYILHKKLKKVFTAIRFLIRIKPKTTLLTAGVASQYDYSFLPDTWFSKSVSAVAQICSKTNAVLPVVLKSYPFYFKIELNCTLVNIEDGTTIDKTYLFPADHAIKISSIKHISDLNNTLQLWIQNSFAADDSVPDTKHRVHEFITFKLKLAKSQQGGTLILKTTSAFGEVLQLLWINILHNVVISDHVQVADLPAICQALNLDLTIYTLDSNFNSLKLYESGIQGSPICLHLDQTKNHYMLLRTLVGYAETIICDKCKKVFAYSKASKYHKHMAKHQKDQNSSKVLIFKDKPIQSSTSLYKQSFGTELVRPLFLAYDFECILKKMKNNEDDNQKTHILTAMSL